MKKELAQSGNAGKDKSMSDPALSALESLIAHSATSEAKLPSTLELTQHLQKPAFEHSHSTRADLSKPLLIAAFAFIFILLVLITISQLALDIRLLDTSIGIGIGIGIGIILAALCIAVAISLGLASKKASLSNEYSNYVAQAVRLNDKVTLKDGTTGTVVDIGAVVTTIRLPNEALKLIDNQEFLNGLIIH